MENADTMLVADALRLGLSLHVKAKNGCMILAQTSRVYRNNKRKHLSREYTLTQSILPDTKHTTHRAEDIARMTIELAGNLAVLEARRLTDAFLSKHQGLAS